MANVTLPLKEIEQIQLPVPSLEEQKEFIKSYNVLEKQSSELSTELTHQLDLVKQLRQAFLREAMQGKLVSSPPEKGGVSGGRGGSPTPPSAGHLPLSGEENASELLQKIKAEKAQLIKEGKLKREKELPPIKPEEIPFEIPKNWVWCRLGEVASIGTGATPLTTNQEYYKEGNIPWITSSATNNLFVNEPELFITEKALTETNCKVYPIGTLVVAMYGQGKTRGQITELNIEAATNQACAAIELIEFRDFHRKFVKYFFRKIYDEI
ncbi:MAG: restriction endonuclease subunit S, partial [Flammeovirgaceae bacterium]